MVEGLTGLRDQFGHSLTRRWDTVRSSVNSYAGAVQQVFVLNSGSNRQVASYLVDASARRARNSWERFTVLPVFGDPSGPVYVLRRLRYS